MESKGKNIRNSDTKKSSTHWLKKILKIVGFFLLGILILAIGLFLFLQTKPGKNLVRKKVVSYLSDKFDSKVEIGEIDYSLPKWLILKNVYFEDPAGKPVLKGKSLLVDLKMLRLINSDVIINKIELEGIELNLTRGAQDSVFNYQFMVDAFASRDTTEKDEDGKKPRMSLDKLQLKEVHVLFDDEYGGMYCDARVEYFDIKMKEFDLDSLDFSFKDIALQNTDVTVVSRKASIVDSIISKVDSAVDATPQATFRMTFDGIAVNKLKVNYSKPETKDVYFNYIDTMLLDKGGVNISNKTAYSGNFLLANSKIEVGAVSGPVLEKIAPADSLTEEAAGWDIRVQSIVLRNNDLKFDNDYYQKNLYGLDPNHLDLKRVTLYADGLVYNDREIKGNVSSAAAYFSDELQLHSMKGEFAYNDSGMYVKDMLVKTNKSVVELNGMISNPLKSDELFNSNSIMTAKFENSRLSYSELRYLVPALRKSAPVNFLPDAIISLNGALSGTTRDLQIHNLDVISSDGRLKFQGRGSLQNVTDPRLIKYNMQIGTLVFQKSLLPLSLQNTLKKSNVRLPDRLSISGTAIGTSRDFNGRLRILSTYGLAQVDAKLNNFVEPKRMLYDVNLVANNLETGKWVGMDSLFGLLNGTVKVKGRGTDLNTLSIDAKTNIRSFVIKHITYDNINLTAKINKGSYDVKGTVGDDMLNTELDVNGIFTGKYPTANGNIILNELDLYAMQLVEDPLRIQGNIWLGVANLSPQSLDAEITMKDSRIITADRTIQVDSMYVKGNKVGDTTTIIARSPVLDAWLKGRYDYENLGLSVQQFLAGKIDSRNPAELPAPAYDQQADLKLTVYQGDMLQSFVPGLKFEDPLSMIGSFNTANRDSILKLYSNIAKLQYNNFIFEELKIAARGNDTALFANVVADQMAVNSNLIYTPTLNIGFARNQVGAQLKTFDRDQKEFYVVNATAQFLPDRTTVSLTNDLVLNYSKWNIENQNAIHILPDGYIAENFRISQGNQVLSVNSPQQTPTSPLDIQVKDFELKTIFAFFSEDSSLQGRLNSAFTVQQPFGSFPVFDGTASLNELTYRKILMGDVNLKASNPQVSTVQLNAAVSGPNDITLNGNIDTKTEQVDMQAAINKLDMKTVEALSNNQLTRTSGDITGNLNIYGPVGAPEWKGELDFRNVTAVPVVTNSPLKINDQKVVLAYPEIRLNKFRIDDTAGHTFTADGVVRVNSNYDFNLDMILSTRDFVAMNSIPNNKQLISGIGVVDLDLTVGGDVLAPEIDGNIVLKNPSDLHFATLTGKDYREDFKKVIQFLDRDTVENLNALFYDVKDTTSEGTRYSGLRYNLNLEVERDAALTMLMDPATGDLLRIQGAAQLNAGIDENGKLGVTGVYNLKDGYYSLTYSVLKRRFELEDGSTITFSGDPMQGQANVTAHYEVDASPRDLLGNEISENSSALGGAYNSKIPFLVILKIDGPVMKPTITFDIKPKENVAGVNSNLLNAIENKLNQFRTDVASMNKQVFALLIMRRFIGERSNDFFAGLGTAANSTVKQSVSQFLSDAVEQMAADLVKGVDINLDIKNYEEEGNRANDRTDVSLGLSKRLLDDRLTVTVGKTFTVDGDDPVAKTQTNNNLQFLPDLSSTYKLTKDGTYSLKAYRRNQYEAILDGYFIETGLLLSFSMNYSRFNEVFRRKTNVN